MEFQHDAKAAIEDTLQEFSCPYCKSKIGHPPIWCRFCLRVLDPGVMIECINCSEPILLNSRFCRFCDVTLRCDLSLSSYAAYITLQAIVQRLFLARRRNDDYPDSGSNDSESGSTDADRGPDDPDDDYDPPPLAGVRRMPLPPPPDEHFVSLDRRGKLKS